jgi:hypothetical protein
MDKALRSFGFIRKEVTLRGKARYYEHKPTGAAFIFPACPLSDRVVDYHLLGVRTSLDLYGIADPATFNAKVKKAG